MGTGPYKITGWMPEQRVTMTINNDWWDKHTSNVKEVIYTPIKSDPTRVAALLSGDVDMLTDLPTQDVAPPAQRPQAEDRRRPRGAHHLPGARRGQRRAEVQQRQGQEPLADKRVRQALSMAIDREAIKRSTMRGLSIPAGVMVAPGVNGNAPKDIDLVTKFDPEGAKKLLAEAGYPDGFEVRFNCAQQPLRQ
jgi:peptide/nickel transport system substrate-binding protein